MSAQQNLKPCSAESAPRSPLRSPAALSRFLLVVVIGLAADLSTKALAFRYLAKGAPQYREVRDPDSGNPLYDQKTGMPAMAWQVDPSSTPDLVPTLLQLHVTVNEGAVFGMGQGNRWLFVVVSVLAMAFLTYLFATSGSQRFYQVLLGMLLAGVLGNMYDRIFHGYVRDMIFIFPKRYWPGWVASHLPAAWDWPHKQVFPWIFNVADMLLCTGVALMLLYSIFAPHPHKPKPDPERRAAPGEPSPARS